MREVQLYGLTPSNWPMFVACMHNLDDACMLRLFAEIQEYKSTGSQAVQSNPASAPLASTGQSPPPHEMAVIATRFMLRVISLSSDRLLYYFKEVLGYFLGVLGYCIGLYRMSPPFRVILSQLVFFLLKTAGACVILWVLLILVYSIYAIDFEWIVAGARYGVFWMWSWVELAGACSQEVVNRATNWTFPVMDWSLPVVNWTSAVSTVRHENHVERILGLERRMSLVELSRVAGVHATPPSKELGNLHALISDQRETHAATERRLRASDKRIDAHMVVYNRDKNDLRGQVLSLTAMLAAENNHSAWLGDMVRALVNHTSSLEGMLATMQRKLERLEGLSMTSLIMTGATTVVGAGAAVASGAGIWTLAMMAGGYVLTALCEYGSLAALEP